MNKLLITLLIGFLFLSSAAMAQNSGDYEEMREINIKYPGQFKAFYSLSNKMTPEEKGLFQKTANKLEAEIKFNDLRNEEKALKEKLSKAGNHRIQTEDGRWLTERQAYSEKLKATRQKRIDTGVLYSVLRQEQAEEEGKYLKTYQVLFQKEEELRKKINTASSKRTVQTEDGRMMTEAQIAQEDLQKVIQQRIDVTKKVALLSEDKYVIGGVKQLVPKKQFDAAGMAEEKPETENLIATSSGTSQNWGSASQASTSPSNSGQNWGSASQVSTASSNSGQSWGSASQVSTPSSGGGQSWGSARQASTQNEVATVAPVVRSKIIPQNIIDLASMNVKNKNASFGTAMGEYVSGIPENVLDEAYRMSSVNGIQGKFIDNYNNNLLKLIQKYGISLKNVAVIKPETLHPQQLQPTVAKTNKKSCECFLPDGTFDSDCFAKKIMPGVMNSVSESIRAIPVQY